MIDRKLNPDFLNFFLDYSITILNKSPNSIKEYNYDLANFFKFIKIEKKLTKENDYSKIIINDMTIDDIKIITVDDIHRYISYMATELRSKPATRARKLSSIRIFFKYMSQKAKLIDVNPAQDLETPKLRKKTSKIFIFR